MAIKSKTKTKVTDTGKKKLLAEMSKMRKAPFVKIGVLGAAGKDAKTTTDGKNSPLSVIAVAVFNEFGTETIPERPFIRTTARKKRKEVQQFEKQLIGMVLRSKGSFGMKRVLNGIGLKFQTLIQKGFREEAWKPNSPKTVSRKGSSQPLIDTGQLRQSISYKVEKI